MSKSVARLFQQFQPSSYDLALELNRDNMTFKGTVSIRGKKIDRPAQRLTLHQKDLKISNASIIKHDKKGDQSIKVARINTHKSFTEVRLHAETLLFPGDYTVTMAFSGTITRPMNGIYPCFFKHDGQDKILLATQFESHHAREAFPCIDEPEAKATFNLTLVTPLDETVIANTPIKEQKVEKGSLLTIFETTPRMSSYLLAFACGELGYSEAVTQDGITVRAYATPANVELTQHALNVAVRALEFFGDYFATPYPLKKLDMLSLPDFSSGAMENWGLVTYRETTMLADEEHSSIETKQMIALVVCHELSHQWFGNLVTMRWWDDLWLNESFANMMEYRAVDELYPEWHIWEQFVSSEGASAKRRDSLLDVQPIRSKVRHPDEISTLFDPSIVYAKGGTILHMLMHYIGEDAFRAGLQQYFKKHAYNNTTATDLWEALSASSKLDIDAFMFSWLNRPGYPLIEVKWQPGDKEVSLTQRRFISDPSVKPNKEEAWPVTLAPTYELDSLLLTTKEARLSLKNASTDQPLLLNHNGRSYCLPHYIAHAHQKQIIKAIQNSQVDAIDRLLLLDNSILLQRGGESATSELLSLLDAFEHEINESVWGSLALAISEVRRLIEDDEASEDRLNSLIARLAEPIIRQLGWDDLSNDSAQTLRLRGLTLSLGASAKMENVIQEARVRFKNFQRPNDLPATIRPIIYFVVIRHGSAADFAKLLKLYEQIQNADERDELAAGLTATQQPEQYKRLLDLLTTDSIRRQDLMHWFVWLLRNRYSRVATWKWLTKHWQWIENEFQSDKSYSFFARYAGSVFSHSAELKQFQDFFADKKSIALSRDIALGVQEIKSRVAWRQRNEDDVKAWLKSEQSQFEK